MTVYQQDFENTLDGVSFVGTGTTVTETDAMSGLRSLRIEGYLTGIRIASDMLKLQPGETYIIELDYQFLDVGSELFPLQVFAEWSGLQPFEGFLGGPVNGLSPASGRDRLSVRIAEVEDASIQLLGFGSMVIDDIRVYRHGRSVTTAELPLIKAGFPRLGNYNLFSTFATAARTGQSLTEVEDLLGLMDLVTGMEIEHTLGPVGGPERLRELNPDILIFPYFQSSVTQRPFDENEPLGGSAGLRTLFNRGLREEWFMRGPTGELLNEPLYPDNFQMNHTRFGPRVEGWSYVNYVMHYVTQTVLPSGKWDGIHFDQPEWYPNPLLAEGDPFLSGTGPLPPVDLDGDGEEESKAELHEAWSDAFYSYFSNLHDRLGYTTLLFGNVGYIPDNPAVLSHLNGWQREFVLPYFTEPNGDWDTSAVGGWYRFANNYFTATTFARAPQVINLQFTGYGLGQPNGKTTANGLADREPELEPRDFRRMRLGLTTTLMSDGFFGYDYVNNTTAPVWFDEYAVGGTGTPVQSMEGKGYLGQPLASATELPYGLELVLNLDFESEFPSGVELNPNFRLTTDPSEVLDGTQSIVFSASHVGELQALIRTPPGLLETGSTYQLVLDYKLADYQPQTYVGLLAATITTGDVGLTEPTSSRSHFHARYQRTGTGGASPNRRQGRSLGFRRRSLSPRHRHRHLGQYPTLERNGRCLSS